MVEDREAKFYSKRKAVSYRDIGPDKWSQPSKKMGVVGRADNTAEARRHAFQWTIVYKGDTFGENHTGLSIHAEVDGQLLA